MAERRQIGQSSEVGLYTSVRPPSRKEKAYPHWVFFPNKDRIDGEDPTSIFTHCADSKSSRARLISFHRLAVKRNFGSSKRRSRTRPVRSLNLMRVEGLTENYVVPWSTGLDNGKELHHIDVARQIAAMRIRRMMHGIPSDLVETMIEIFTSDDEIIELLNTGGTAFIFRSDINYLERVAEIRAIYAQSRFEYLQAIYLASRPRKQKNLVMTKWNSGSINLRKFGSEKSGGTGIVAPEHVTDPIDAVLIPRLELPSLFDPPELYNSLVVDDD